MNTLQNFTQGDPNDPYWTPGMMYDPTTKFQTEYSPNPIEPLEGFDFDANQRQINKDRSVNVGRVMADGSQMVKPINNRPITQIKLPSNIPGVQGRPAIPQATETDQDKDKKGVSPYLPFAVTGIMGKINDWMSNRDQEEEYQKVLRRLGNSDSMQSTTPQNVYGDHTLNTGVGTNYRLNQTGFRNFEEGGEYEMSEEEIKMFLESGGQVEFL